MVQAGFTNPDIARLHSCGRSETDQNTHSRFVKLFSEDCGLGDRIPGVAGGGSATQRIPPSMILKMLHSFNPDRFRAVFQAHPARLVWFWQELFASEEGRLSKENHHILRHMDPRDLHRTIPITLHEDAAPYSKSHSCDNVSWSPLLGSGSELSTTILHHTELEEPGHCQREPCWLDLFFGF